MIFLPESFAALTSPQGEVTRILAPVSPGRRAGEVFAPLREEGALYLHSATPGIVSSNLKNLVILTPLPNYLL